MLVYCMNLKKMERYLRVNLLGPGPRFMKNNLPGRSLTKVEKHCCSRSYDTSVASSKATSPQTAI